jgi:hypothetical protein
MRVRRPARNQNNAPEGVILTGTGTIEEALLYVVVGIATATVTAALTGGL